MKRYTIALLLIPSIACGSMVGAIQHLQTFGNLAPAIWHLQEAAGLRPVQSADIRLCGDHEWLGLTVPNNLISTRIYSVSVPTVEPGHTKIVRFRSGLVNVFRELEFTESGEQLVGYLAAPSERIWVQIEDEGNPFLCTDGEIKLRRER